MLAAGQHVAVEEYQRKLWQRMLERIDAFEAGQVGLSKLASDLRGLR